MGDFPSRARSRCGGRTDPPPRVRSRREGRDRLSRAALTLERVVRPTGPFSLAQTLRHPGDATRYQRDGTLTTTLRVGDRVELGSVSQLADGRVGFPAAGEAGFERAHSVGTLT